MRFLVTYLLFCSFAYVLFACSECALTKDNRAEVLAGPRGGVVADDAPEPMDTAEENQYFSEAVPAAFAS